MKQLDFVDQVASEPVPAPAPGRRNQTGKAPAARTATTKPRPKNRPAGSREDMQRLNMELPRTLHKRLKLKAIYEDRTVTDLVLQAINEYLHTH